MHSTSLDKRSGEAHEIFDNQWSLGDSLLKARQFGEAALHYQAALSYNPKATWVLLDYGDALKGEGKRVEARLAWKKAMALEPPPSYYGAQARQKLAQN